MKALRKLVLGETRALPIGIAVAVGVAAILDAVTGPADWWSDAGGFILLAMLGVAFVAALGFRR